MSRWRVWLPLLRFVSFIGLAGWQLTQPNDEFVESRMIGKPLPYFALPAATPDRPALAAKDFADGKPRLLNIWASWCAPCKAEAPQLEQLRAQGADIMGVAIRDRPDDIARFLAQYGNPYAAIGRDERTVGALVNQKVLVAAADDPGMHAGTLFAVHHDAATDQAADRQGGPFRTKLHRLAVDMQIERQFGISIVGRQGLDL